VLADAGITVLKVPPRMFVIGIVDLSGPPRLLDVVEGRSEPPCLTGFPAVLRRGGTASRSPRSTDVPAAQEPFGPLSQLGHHLGGRDHSGDLADSLAGV
jgi:hypothetical protein